MVHHSEAELVTDFGTFGQGMLVNWQYTIPENGTVVAQMDLRGHNDVPLHIKPYYGSNVRYVYSSKHIAHCCKSVIT